MGGSPIAAISREVRRAGRFVVGGDGVVREGGMSEWRVMRTVRSLECILADGDGWFRFDS